MTTRVYLAGKISPYDWRMALFPSYGIDQLADGRQRWRVAPRQDRGETWEWAGPFFLSCDHGCYHGAGAHGVGQGLPWTCGSAHALAAAEVVARCWEWLAAADCVFAWLDAPDAYGTLVELGYAMGRGRPVFVAWATAAAPVSAAAWWRTLGDQWFLRTVADAWCVAPTVHDAWHAFTRWWCGRAAAARDLAAWRLLETAGDGEAAP